MESADQVDSPAWRLWAKLASPALLRYPVLGISAVLVVSTPLAAAARTLPRSPESASSEPTQRQLRVLRSYERYLARVRAQTVKARRAVRFAYRQVGKPYQWGGAGPRTYDCSGLVMAAWRKGGLRLPHRADLQHRMIRRRVGIRNLQPGDLVFFSGDHHVGIYVGRHHFLHAPHTGARVQRGTLSGWRLRAFAGAARPGAPAYHAWPHWVHTLADEKNRRAKDHRHQDDGGVSPSADTGTPSDETSAEAPAQDQPSTDTPASAGEAPASSDGGAASSDGGAASSGEAPASAGEGAASAGQAPASSGLGAASSGASHATGGAAGSPAAGGGGSLAGGLLSPLVRMAAPAPRAHAQVAADTTPEPPSATTSGPGHTSTSGPASPRETAKPHSRPPRSIVKRQHDEQRFDRDYDDQSAGDEDSEPDNDGIDWRALLGNTR